MAKIVVIAEDAAQQAQLTKLFKDIGTRANTDSVLVGLSPEALAAFKDRNMIVGAVDSDSVLGYVSGKPRSSRDPGAPANEVMITTSRVGGAFGFFTKPLDTELLKAEQGSSPNERTSIVYASGREAETTVEEVQALLLRTVERVAENPGRVSDAAMAEYRAAMQARAREGSDGLYQEKNDPGNKYRGHRSI